MDKKQDSKKKISIKANTGLEKKLILKKEFIITKKQSPLVLDKIYNKEKANHINNSPAKKDMKLKVINSNIVNLGQKQISKSDKILDIKNISKSLGGKPILKNISFSLNRGQILGLLGPNGAGKSTLFSLIVGKIFPDSGEIALNNEIINNLPIHKTALKGTENLLKLSVKYKIKKFFFFSVLQVYGKEIVGNIRSKKNLKLQNDYAISHFKAEELIKNYHKRFKLNVKWWKSSADLL